jgi:hypothetical protein
MKISNEKMMSSFLLSHHHLLVKCTTNVYYNFFHIGFEIIFYDYTQLCSHLKHLVIDFLVAKDKIPFSVGQPIINESFVDHSDPMHIKKHICLHLMRMSVYEYLLQHVYSSSR